MVRLYLSAWIKCYHQHQRSNFNLILELSTYFYTFTHKKLSIVLIMGHSLSSGIFLEIDTQIELNTHRYTDVESRQIQTQRYIKYRFYREIFIQRWSTILTLHQVNNSLHRLLSICFNFTVHPRIFFILIYLLLNGYIAFQRIYFFVIELLLVELYIVSVWL